MWTVYDVIVFRQQYTSSISIIRYEIVMESSVYAFWRTQRTIQCKLSAMCQRLLNFSCLGKIVLICWIGINALLFEGRDLRCAVKLVLLITGNSRLISVYFCCKSAAYILWHKIFVDYDFDWRSHECLLICFNVLSKWLPYSTDHFLCTKKRCVSLLEKNCINVKMFPQNTTLLLKQLFSSKTLIM